MWAAALNAQAAPPCYPFPAAPPARGPDLPDRPLTLRSLHTLVYKDYSRRNSCIAGVFHILAGLTWELLTRVWTEGVHQYNLTCCLISVLAGLAAISAGCIKTFLSIIIFVIASVASTILLICGSLISIPIQWSSVLLMLTIVVSLCATIWGITRVFHICSVGTSQAPRRRSIERVDIAIDDIPYVENRELLSNGTSSARHSLTVSNRDNPSTASGSVTDIRADFRDILPIGTPPPGYAQNT